MLTFENMATFVCHYGGTPKPELEKMYHESLNQYHHTKNILDKVKADKFLTIIKMMENGVHFVSHEQASTFYFVPEEGWNIIHEYLQ